MRKRKRAKKDPNAPKRALSAFFFFSQVRCLITTFNTPYSPIQLKRQGITGEHSDWKVGQVAQELGRMWKLLTDDEKKVYEKMAIDDKARYEVEMRDYKNGGLGRQGVPMGGVPLPQGSQQHNVQVD